MPVSIHPIGEPIEISCVPHIEWQRAAEQPGAEWRFDQPHRVASEVLAQSLNIPPLQVTELQERGRRQGRLTFRLRAAKGQYEYRIVVSRPYELSFHAKDSNMVAWVVLAIWEFPRK